MKIQNVIQKLRLKETHLPELSLRRGILNSVTLL